MKDALILILAAIAVLAVQPQANGQDREHRTVHNIKEIPELQRVVEKYSADGSVIFVDDAGVSEAEILRHLEISDEMTFDLQNKRQSRFSHSTTYLRFQQFYKGVKVENGGYAIKSEGELPGDGYGVKQFSPFLYYDISIDVDPDIEESDITQILRVNNVRSAELLISDRFSVDYKLDGKCCIGILT
jgi:hypothetical protein